MTDAATPQSEPPADLRASDRDRDAALEVLADAASDGRLTLDEYSAAPVIEIRASAVLGSVTVRPPRVRDRLRKALRS